MDRHDATRCFQFFKHSEKFITVLSLLVI